MRVGVYTLERDGIASSGAARSGQGVILAVSLVCRAARNFASIARDTLDGYVDRPFPASVMVIVRLLGSGPGVALDFARLMT